MNAVQLISVEALKMKLKGKVLRPSSTFLCTPNSSYWQWNLVDVELGR